MCPFDQPETQRGLFLMCFPVQIYFKAEHNGDDDDDNNNNNNKNLIHIVT